MRTETVKNMCGGLGHTVIKHVLEGEQLGTNCGLYAQVTLEPGCSLGYHEHHGESEAYYILSGEGIYSDNGKLQHVHAGDVTVTTSGQGHALTNLGQVPLVFMALILRD